MRRPRPAPSCVVVAVTALLATVAGGCTGDGSTPGPEDLDIDLVVGARVAVVDRAFRPRAVTVSGGEVVEFTNEGREPHTITADDGTFDAGEQLPGETFSFITDPVEEPLEVTYHCELHPDQMRGRLTIQPPGEPGADDGS